LEGALTCNLKFGGHDFLDKKTNVEFDATSHCLGGLLDYVHVDVWGPTKNASLGCHQYFVSFIDDLSKRCWVYSIR